MGNGMKEVLELLDAVAVRGFMSEEVPSEYCASITRQRVQFTSYEKKVVRAFMAQHHRVFSSIDYPMSSFFGDREERTASLLCMFSSMLNGSDPEYVAANAQRLRNAEYKFAADDFVKEMERLME